MRKRVPTGAKILAVLVLVIVVFIGWAASPRSVPSKEVHFYQRFQTRVVGDVPTALTIITYNIGYASGRKNNQPERLTRAEGEKNLDAMVDVLQNLGPDLIFLQEVDFDAARTYGINQMEYLANRLGFPYAASVVTWNKRYVPWPYWPPQIHFGRMLSGQAVLSRFPIVGQEIFRFSKPVSNPFWYNWFYLDRVVQKVKLQIGANQWSVWNVHLEAFDPGLRTEQLQQVASMASTASDLRIIAGDFNEDPGNIFSGMQKISFASFSSWEPVKRLDHILTRRDWSLQKSGTLPLQSSDHLPVWGRFTFSSNN